MRNGVFHAVVNGDYTPTMANSYIPVGVLTNENVIGITLDTNNIIEINKDNTICNQRVCPLPFAKMYGKELQKAQITFTHEPWKLCLYFGKILTDIKDEDLFSII